MHNTNVNPDVRKVFYAYLTGHFVTFIKTENASKNVHFWAQAPST